jgi:hypothetical protein
MLTQPTAGEAVTRSFIAAHPGEEHRKVRVLQQKIRSCSESDTVMIICIHVAGINNQ